MQKFLRTLTLLALLSVPWVSSAQETVTIGTGTSTSYYVPFNSLYGYSFSEWIYSASDIDMSGSITTIRFYLGTSNSTAQTNDYTIWMKNVTRSSFSTTTDYETVTTSDVVFNGQWTIPANYTGWVEIELDTPFAYDGSSNLMIAVHEYTSGYSTRYFTYTSVTNCGIQQYSDGTNPDPYNLASYSGSKTLRSYLPNIQLDIAPLSGYCPRPSGFSFRDLNSYSVTLGWSISSLFDNVNSVYVEYGPMDFTPGSGTTASVTGDSAVITGLTPGTWYKACAFSNCGTDGYSDTAWVTFFTPSLPVVDLPYSTGFEEGEDLEWALNNGLNGWYIDTAAKNGGDYGLYISADTGQTNGYIITTSCDSYAARNFTLDSGMYAIGFDWRGVGESGCDYVKVYLAPGSTDMNASSLSTTGWSPISGNLCMSGEWQSTGLQFNVPADGDYFIVFQWHNDGSAGSAPAGAVDNVELRQLTCQMPTGLQVESYGITYANLSWHPGDAEEEWALSVNGSEWHQVLDTTVLIDTLRDNTPYTFRLKSVCGPDDSSFIVSTSITTLEYCYPVTGIAASSIGFTSAGLTWTPSSNGDPATAVTVSLTCNDSTVTSVPAPQTVTGNSVLFSGLQPATSYTATFATVCGEHNAHNNPTLTFMTSSCGEVSGTASTSYAPFYTLYDYSYSQTLYDADIVAAIDSITGISYEITSPQSGETATVDIYMAYTDLTVLSTTNYVAASDLTKVVSDAQVDVGQAGWVTITFDTAFYPTGSGKLVVAVVNKTGDWFSTVSWGAQSAPAGSSVYWYRDGTIITPASPGGTSGTLSYITNTRFLGNCDLNSCMASNVAITGSTTTSIDISWVTNGSENAWVAGYRPLGGDWVYESTTLTGNTYTFTNLTPSMGYEMALGSLCGDETSTDTLWTTVIGYTECALGALPYENSFTAALGPCWNTTSVTRNTSNLLYFSSTNSRAILPELPLENVMIMMSLRGTTNGGLKLGVTENNGQTVEWLDTVAIASSSELNTVSSTLQGYAGEATRLVLAPVAGTSTVYIDYINIDVNAGCTPVENLTVTNLHGNTATIHWNSTQTSFNVSWREAGSSDWNDTVVTDDSIAFTTLTPQTSYELRVRPDCSQSESFWMTVSFTTPCAVYPTPFFEDFNATTLSSCWTRANGLFGDGTPAVYSGGWSRYTSYVFTDGHYKVNIYSTSCKYWLITPEIQLGENMELSFDAAFTAYASSGVGSPDADDRFIVAVSTDGNNWTPLATWGSAANDTYTLNSIPNTGANYTLNLAAYNNQIVRIAFYGESTVSGGDNDLHIDNINVLRGGCGVPTALTVDTNITYNTATLSWSDTTESMTAYEVVYGTVNNINDSSNHIITVGVPTVTLTGLHNGTTYYAWVRTVCDDYSSMWTNSVSFYTPRSCYSPTSYEIANVGFSTANFSWSYNDAQVASGLPITGTIVRIVNESDPSVADLVQTVTGTSMSLSGLTPGTNYRVYLTTICDPDTTYAVSFPLSTTGCAEESTGGFNISYMPFYGFYGYGYSQSIYPGEILQYMDTIRGISYKLNSVPSSYTTRPVSVYLGHTNRTSLDVDSYVPVDSLQLMVTNFQMDLSHTGWTTIIFDTFFVYDGTSDILVAVDNNTGSYSSFNWMGHQVDGYKGVYWYRDGTDIDPADPTAGSPSGAHYNLLPDIRFDGNCLLGTCLPPMLVIDSITTNTAFATLTPGDEDSIWVVKYRLYGDDTWTITPASGLTTRTITGLQPSSLYEFRAGSLCGTDTIWARIIDKYTECAPIDVPMVENFDNGITPCWMDTLTTTYINTATGDMYIYLGDHASYLKTPVITASVDTLQVRVNMHASTAGQMLRVGVSDENGNNIEWLDSIASQSTSVFNEEILFIHNYSGSTTTNRRIVLAPAGTATYYYVTSVTVEPLMPCLPIRNLHAIDTATTSTSVTLDWTDLLTPDSWAIEYGPENFTLGTGSVMNATAHPVTISGLTSSTSYHFYVTPVCSADSGITAGPIRVVTEFEPCEGGVMAENYTASQTATTSSYSPIGYALYNYSYVQTIIDSSVMANFTGDIVSFAFNANTVTAGSEEYNNMTIYMANVSESSLSAGFIHPDSAHVFVEVLSNATLNFSETGWNYVNFTAPFTWDGHSNVLFASKRDNGTWASSPSFVAHTQTGAKMRSVYTDDAPYDINTVTGGSTYDAVGDIRLISCGETIICNAPVDLTVTDTAETSISISWSSEETSFEVAYVEGDYAAFEAATLTPEAVSTTTATVTGLSAETQYTIGVRTVCSESRKSDWVTVTVTTTAHPCAVPTALTSSDVDYNSAYLSWTAGEEGQDTWELHVTGDSYDQTFTVNDNPSHDVTGLSHGTTYTFTVRAICTGNNPSEWSTPQTFTTTTCQPVTGVRSENVTSSGATISWTAPAGATNFELEYGMSGFNRGQGTTVTANTNSYAITGLSANMAYDVYVRTICATGVYSSWSTKTEFTTSDGEGIDDVNAAAISLYPNPASSTVTLTGIEGMATVTVVDMNGRVSGEWNVTDGKLTIDVSEMAQGAYFVRIVGEQVNAIRKLIVR